jgi:vacuolar-type H+-ATPase subunit F/Vma7
VNSAVRVVCGATAAVGFRLAGLVVDEVASTTEAALRLSAWSERDALDVVLIEEDLHAGLPDEVLVALERRGRPILVPFPGPSWIERPDAEARVIEILRRAIGYRVHL